ncbi:hypothetical protein CA850_04820 [Micromonospora echinospora]|uniref:Uncharacterized conserved protein, DUF1800 family n=1 Tax=Micromonospora echinospora TaxID=1877 RepID=A0A1C4ZUY0_MICEC|nr:DUF1800 family protein [Micromonospora echinospora]OZV83955.1 hypothetical protein CA850_04820 [Micromonospora echinospora]SCF36753.1 Uncharacterized conserved protein, DUF1800 family [Micromonospora echinospora]
MTDDVALLLRRAGFGPTAAELTAARRAGHAATLTALTSPPGPDIGATRAPLPRLGPDPYARTPTPSPEQRIRADDQRRSETTLISRWWLDRMTVADHQATEKLLFFWHGHWATSIVKVKSAQLMLAQHGALRAARDFVDMVHRMVVDPALVYWLDGQFNSREAPNENLARELLELFTVGIGRYTEADVRDAGRALTGWRIDLAGERTTLDPRRHDDGEKTILGETGAFTAHGLADLLLRQPACPRFVATRLWHRYASSHRPVPEPTLAAMVAAYPDPMAMLRALLADEAFPATRSTMVKQPVEWLVGAMRQLALRPATMPTETVVALLDGLGGLGQRPFAPPSVGGWPAGAAWLTSAAARLKLHLAGKLAALRSPEGLTPEEVAHLLCVDRWTDRTYAVLRAAGNSRLMLTLGLVSPEYAVT